MASARTASAARAGRLAEPPVAAFEGLEEGLHSRRAVVVQMDVGERRHQPRLEMVEVHLARVRQAVQELLGPLPLGVGQGEGRERLFAAHHLRHVAQHGRAGLAQFALRQFQQVAEVPVRMAGIRRARREGQELAGLRAGARTVAAEQEPGHAEPMVDGPVLPGRAVHGERGKCLFRARLVVHQQAGARQLQAVARLPLVPVQLDRAGQMRAGFREAAGLAEKPPQQGGGAGVLGCQFGGAGRMGQCLGRAPETGQGAGGKQAERGAVGRPLGRLPDPILLGIGGASRRHAGAQGEFEPPRVVRVLLQEGIGLC